MTNTIAGYSDHFLVARCLENDGVAWRLLINRYQPMLLGVICQQLGSYVPGRTDLAEDLCQELWVSVFSRGGRRLRTWRADQETIGPFLAAMARQVVLGHLRKRQLPLRPMDETHEAVQEEVFLVPLSLHLEDFLPQLSPQEDRFLRHLLGEQDQTMEDLTPVHRRQLKHQVLKKLRRYLSGD